MKRYLYKIRLESESYLNTSFVLYKGLGLSFSITKDICMLPLGVEVELVSRFGLKSEDPRLLINSDKTTDELIAYCEDRDIFIKIKNV